MTPDNRYALTRETLKLLSLCDVPVTITMLTTEPALRGGFEKSSDPGMRNGDVSVVVYEHLRRMAQAGSHIKLEFIDPDLNPDVVNEYKKDYPYIARGSVIFYNHATDRFKVVYWSDLVALSPEDQELYDMYRFYYGVEIDPPSDSYLITSEGVLSSALQFVLNEKNALAAFIIGHEAPKSDEDDPAVRKAMMSRLLQRANFETLDVDLRVSDIPQEVDLLILMAPYSDFSDAELKRMDTYLSSARKHQAAIFFAIAYGAPLPNYTEWLAEWGVGLENKIVIDNQMPEAPAAFNPLYKMLDIFGGMNPTVAEDSVLVTQTAPLTMLFNVNAEGKGERGKRMTEELMASRDSCEARDLSGGGDAVKGRFILGALCWQNNVESVAGMSDLTSYTRMAVLPGMLADPVGMSYAANDRMLINVINYLVPQTVTVDAPVRKLVNAPLLLDKYGGNYNVVLSALYVAFMAIPAALLVMGFVVFLKRKNK